MTTGAVREDLPTGEELARLSSELERRPASAAVSWALERFGPDGVVVSSSFQDSVLIDVATSVAPAIQVVFLDTGFHFPETLEYVEAVRLRYDLNLTIIRPDVDAATWPCGTDECCRVRKVEPLNRLLRGRSAWITGLRRSEAPTRAGAPVVAQDPTRGVVKVNPLATWTDLDVSGYTADRGLLVHPLTERGYLSIGCAPTTTPVRPGDDPRSGRWAGTDKTECGLHEPGS
ncbi:MAG TPA: phosphoadenylyl-sulfate reductase [Acidimicrobiales bacterium]|nr:phosphoadenylyl-sulfate reductase [Acidimicrobiales bacterium]